MSAPKLVDPSACTWCAIARREHGRQFADAVGWHQWAAPSQEQILARMKARRLALTVARLGALPVPVGENVLPVDALLERASSVATQLYSYTASVGEEWDWLAGFAVPELVAQAKRLRARVAELEAARQADHETWQHDLRTARAEREASAARIAEPAPTVFRASSGSVLLGLYGREEDALSHCEDAARRGVDGSNPMSWRKHPDGTRELRAWTSRDVEGGTGFTVAPVEVRPEFDEGWGEDADEPDGITRLITPTHALREDDDPARCLKRHPFSPRDGWRMVCGNCDHGKDASCHGDGA